MPNRRAKARKKRGRRTKQQREEVVALRTLEPVSDWRKQHGDVETEFVRESLPEVFTGSRSRSTAVWRIDTLLANKIITDEHHAKASKLRRWHDLVWGQPRVTARYSDLGGCNAPPTEAVIDASRKLKAVLRRVGIVASPVLVKVVFFDETPGGTANTEILRRALDAVY